MARPHSNQEAISESLQAGGGFAKFRSVSERPKEFRDGPLGPPPERPVQPTPTPTPIVNRPSIEARRSEPKPEVFPAKPQAQRAKPSEVESPSTSAPDSFTEKVSLPLTRSLRDRSEQLARLLNRSRTIRKSRITSNSIIRVALETFLDSFAPPSSQSINSEEDLLKAVRHKPR